MIDWNDNGSIDPEEFVVTAMLLDDEIQGVQEETGEEDVQYSKESGVPRIGCLIGMGVIFVFVLRWMTNVIQ